MSTIVTDPARKRQPEFEAEPPPAVVRGLNELMRTPSCFEPLMEFLAWKRNVARDRLESAADDRAVYRLQGACRALRGLEQNLHAIKQDNQT